MQNGARSHYHHKKKGSGKEIPLAHNAHVLNHLHAVDGGSVAVFRGVHNACCAGIHVGVRPNAIHDQPLHMVDVDHDRGVFHGWRCNVLIGN